MKTFIRSGDIVPVTAPYAVSSGGGCLVGSIFGIAVADALISTTVQLQTVGEFTIAKTSALAISAGDPLYWDDTLKVVNKTSSGVQVGVATVAAANPSSTVQMRLTSGYSGTIGESVIRQASISITNAQIKALRATPKTLVAAQGATKYLEFISLVMYLDYGSNVFTESTDNMAVRFTDGSGAIVSQAIEATGFIDAAADTITNGLPKIDAIVSAAASLNQALVLHNTGDGEYGGNAGADTVIRAIVTYRIHTP